MIWWEFCHGSPGILAIHWNSATHWPQATGSTFGSAWIEAIPKSHGKNSTVAIIHGPKNWVSTALLGTKPPYYSLLLMTKSPFLLIKPLFVSWKLMFWSHSPPGTFLTPPTSSTVSSAQKAWLNLPKFLRLVDLEHTIHTILDLQKELRYVPRAPERNEARNGDWTLQDWATPLQTY